MHAACRIGASHEQTLTTPSKRQLDDEELDSGDDEGREDRLQDAEAEEQPEYAAQEKLTMDIEIPRQPLPEPSDGEMYLMKVPAFMAIEPVGWRVVDFQPPVADHHLKEASDTFSAYNTAMSTIRWRRSPSNPAELQSNARINRWSDGSLTVQLASEPTVQYEMDPNPLAPPQRNPLKPTPTSVKAQKSGTYNEKKDQFTYLIAPVMAAESLRVTHKITTGLQVKQSASATDDAVEKLQKALATAAKANNTHGGGIEMVKITEDPEMQRKRAEVAEKEKARARKRREAQEERERDRSNRTLGRHGLSTGRFGGAGGLTTGMLEDDELGAGRPRPKQAKKARPRKANSEYSSDEDHGRRAFHDNDEYDRDDGFVADSDEEEGMLEEDDDEDPDDGIVEEPRRERTPKRPAPAKEASGAGEDEDAEGEVDDEVVQQAGRKKRQRVVSDDEDE